MPTKSNEKSYQELADRLDEVTSMLQSPDVSIDDAVTLYKNAMELIQKLEQHLSNAENKINEIKARFTES